ncbi:MAG: Crp/Fnr family transcriptional regulator [Chloroflexi bacterium]|nr:Crp/Fnr family transcriptional regulator [Chloroflexota bacterium]
MVSPELLRRSPFFAFTDENQKKAVAMISEEAACDGGTVFFEEGQVADTLYLLLEGSVDLFFRPHVENGDQLRPDILVGEINPGEPFGLSAMIEPHILTATATASGPCRVLKMEGAALRALSEVDCRLGYLLMRQIAKAVGERLHAARLQLAATRV